MKPLKKVFAITMFGTPFPWIHEFIDHVQHLQQYGWYWKIFTPNDIPSKGNVEIVSMGTNEFNDLVEKKLSVRPEMYMTEKGVPSVHVTDFYVFSGIIFEDYLKDADFWGITNLDVVYGRLDHFLPDSGLNQCDVFTDDLNTINGVFCLFRNTSEVNTLCLQVPNWKEKISQLPCLRCLTGHGNHTLYGTDEYDMTEIMKNPEVLGKIRYHHPKYSPIHSHDRLEQHVPDVKLKMQEDGSLWELFKDTAAPNWIHARPFLGREIPYFHFIRTKEWPKSLTKQS